MANFYKPNTLIKTISFMAFFVAINVISSLFTVIFPLLSVFLILFLPLTSAIVEVNCKDRWFPIYAFATIGLSIVVTLSSIDFTLFYIVPSIFTGYIFGLFSKRKLPRIFSLFIATIIQTSLSLLSIPILNLITGIKIVAKIAEILRISNTFLFNSSILLLFFLVSLIQVILSFIVVDSELKKFGLESASLKNETRLAPIAGIILVLIGFIFAFFYLPVCLLFVGISFFFTIYIVIFQFQNRNTLCLIIDGIALFVGVLLYAALNKYFKPGFDFSLFLIAPCIISIVSMAHSFLKKSE